MKSIDVTQAAAKKQTTPLKHSSKALAQPEFNVASFEELEVSSQQFRLLSRGVPIGLALYKVIYNKAGAPVGTLTLEVNPEYERTLGKTRNQLVGKKMAGFLLKAEDAPVDWIAIMNRAATTNVPEIFEIRYPQSKHFYQVYVFSPKSGYCIVSLRDITAHKQKIAQKLTEQKKAEQELVVAEKRYRRLYETTQDGIMARDLEGNMIDCNPAYAKMLGYTKKELRRLSVKQLLPERWHMQREKIANKVMQTGRSIVFEREYTRKDGSVFPASVRTWRLTDGRGKVIGIWSIVRDISEQKQLQRDLEEHAGVLEKIVEDRTKQLKDTERLVAIGQTAGMVGHDLRNPLQTITGELYLAKTEVESLTESEAKCNLQENLQAIEEQAAYMDKIVSDLQAFVQPVKTDKKSVNLPELIESVLSTVAVPGNVSVEMQSKGVLYPVKADPQLLKRVLINLVTNAVQAMPKGGSLTLTTNLDPQGQVAISVQDTGVGMSDAIKSQIFTPLFTTKPRGQGFGLAVCKRVIEAHGGSISFESAEGKGANFTIQFPAS